MTQVLVKIYIQNCSDKIFFWSVVLDTVLNSSEFNCNQMNSVFKSIKIKALEDFYVSFDFSFFDEKLLICDKSNYIKRPSFFLSKEFSPYKNCCCMVKNYYNPNQSHQDDLLQFVKTFIDITDNVFLEFQQEILEIIKSNLGIDILKSESMPGCFSVYTSLPSFVISIAQRRIEISSSAQKNYYIELKIEDGNCIIFSNVYEFNVSPFIIQLPDISDLENWFKAKISIYEKDLQKTAIVYEEEFHLTREVCGGINTFGGVSSLVKNRFSNKVEKIPRMCHSNISTSDKTTPWHDWIKGYRNYLCLEKQYLESIFFDFTRNGQNEFVNWMKDNFSNAKSIYIIDPYFDLNGLESLISCQITDVSIKLATLNPDLDKRDGDLLTAEKLTSEFYKTFSSGELYFCSKNELHDRYLVIEFYGGSKYYNLSNSWNGAFRNNHSLLISQLSQKNVKKFIACYEDCFTDNKKVRCQQQHSASPNQEKGLKEYCRKDVKELLKKAIEIQGVVLPKEFAALYRSIYVYHAYGKIEKGFVNKFFIKTLNIRNDVFKKDVIEITICELFHEQQNRFAKKNCYCQSTNAKYDDISFVNNIRIHGIHEFDLELDWGYFYMLQALFYEYPEQVITSMYEESKNISKVYVKDGNGIKEEKYDLSRDIICLLLEKRYARIHKRNEKTFIEFAKKTNSVLCKYYILKSYIESYNHEITIQSIENLLNIFQFSLDDRCMIYKNLYNQLSFNNDLHLLTKNDIESYVSYNFINRSELLIDFALDSYVFDKDLDASGLCSFVRMNYFIKDDLFLLILIYSLSSCSDRKLFDFLVKNLRPKYYDLIKNKTVSTLCNFHHYFTPLGQIFAEAVCDNNISFQKIEFKFDMNYKTVFGTIASDKNDSFFILNIIFECLNELKNKGYDISKNVKNIAWYIPVLFNSSSYDMNSNDIKFAQLFSSLCLDQQKKDIHDKLYNERIRQWF